MDALALCSGIGGLEIGLGRAIRGLRVVCHVEREAFPAAVLVARMEDASLAQAPIWDDIASFDGKPWRGLVDLITSGLPCQPYSVAGKQKGHADTRALWPEFCRIVEEVKPAYLFLENVPQFFKHFEQVYNQLRGMGFDFAPPLLLTAQELGATDTRRRFFAAAAHFGRVDSRDLPWRIRRKTAIAECWGRKSRPKNSHDHDRSNTRWPKNSSRLVNSNSSVSDENGKRFESEWCGWIFNTNRQTLRHDPDGCSDGCRIRGSSWDSESPVCRVASRTPYWVDELKAIGNCVTPDQAERAWRELMFPAVLL